MTTLQIVAFILGVFAGKFIIYLIMFTTHSRDFSHELVVTYVK